MIFRLLPLLIVNETNGFQVVRKTNNFNMFDQCLRITKTIQIYVQTGSHGFRHTNKRVRGRIARITWRACRKQSVPVQGVATKPNTQKKYIIL